MTLQRQHFLSFVDNALTHFVTKLNWLLVRVEVFIQHIVLRYRTHILNENGFLSAENVAEVNGVAFAVSFDFIAINALKLFNLRGNRHEPKDVVAVCKGAEVWAVNVGHIGKLL